MGSLESDCVITYASSIIGQAHDTFTLLIIMSRLFVIDHDFKSCYCDEIVVSVFLFSRKVSSIKDE